MSNVDTKIRALRDELSIVIAQESNRIDQVLTTIQSMQIRLDGLEEQPIGRNQSGNDTDGNTQSNGPEVSVTVSGITETQGEDITNKARDLIQALGEDVYSSVHVASANRLPSKIESRPGIIRICFRDTNKKIRVLKNKHKLKESAQYKNVYIRSSKSNG